MTDWNNREDEPCPEGECKHTYDEWPADVVTMIDLAVDQCSNCGWTETERAERASKET